ncbi:isocitrate lyase/PEP mutase family protein [Stutzerimonas azotifigens]|uniref:isocitrate lyase/PEP mutase family protein n=1 Tax=Stutzerimonas azotifigens TaxID=291995 RepID=UPI000407A728|nr:isocitrate lyase/phosphoenolpyruvate mutase family protein [Stutzerimonas azotifigens]
MTYPLLSEVIRQTQGALVAPGVFDAFTATLAAQAGFECLYLSGASIAYTRLGRPDLGLVTMSEVADTVAAIRDRIDTPLIVDADTGYGNALNTQRTVRMFERYGASGIQLEDQTFPKRCGHLQGKSLISPDEMVGKLKAAVDARQHEHTLIVARTDAIAVEGFDRALERAERYLEAGADILFVEAPESREQQLQLGERFARRVPLLANMVEGGRTPVANADALADMGFKVVIFPGGMARALLRCAQDYLSSLKEHGSTQPFRARMAGFDELNTVIGLPELLTVSSKYNA